jgi:hypothetical protein
LKDWEDQETGLIIEENDEWVLVKHIPIDFVVDGYKLIKKEFIESRTHSEKLSLVEKVLALKGIGEGKPESFSFGDTTSILRWVEKKYGLFEFQDHDPSEVFYGRINRIENESLILDSITVNGELVGEYNYEFEIEQIRVISFETDYFNSIKLLMEDKMKNSN